jgi:O-antigen ligase
MAAAVVLRLAVSLSGSRITRNEGRFAAARVLAAVLLVWLGFEVVRNVGAYRLSSVREFAVENLVIIVPVYLAIFLRSERTILRAFKGVAVFALVSPLALIPVIGSLKGWGIGSADRFYPAVVHLGLLFGVLSLLLLKKYGQLRVGWWILYLGTFAAAALIVVDGHRSVWLSCGTAAAVLVLLGEIRLRRFWHWGFAALGLVAAAALALSIVGLDVPRYVATRASAFVNPVNDPTSDWRFSIWRQALPIAKEHLIAGQGFGGYYTWLASGGSSFSVTPHDMYIQMLLKTGMIGLGLAIALGVVALVGLKKGWRVARGRHDTSATPVIVVGIAAVVVTFAWGVVYQPVVYSFIFAGLGLAAAIVVCSQRGESRLPT